MSFTHDVTALVEENSNGLLDTHRSWTRVPLGDVFDVQNGCPFDSKHFNERGDGMPLLRIRDVVPGTTETFYSGPYEAAFVVSPGDIVVGMDGDFNVRPWRGPAALLNQRVCRLLPRGGYPLGLLAIVLQGYLDAINAHTSSITVKHLSSKTVAEIPLPLPPSGEQQRIVEALDSYLSRLDAAVASLERVQANLKAYRASVLKAAVEGRLVPTEAALARQEKRDYEPASALLDRILKERRRHWEEAELARLKKAGKAPKDDKWKARYEEPEVPDTSKLPELPEGWCWASVDALLAAIETGKNFACDERPPDVGEVGVVKVSAVTWGFFDENESKTCTRPELVDEEAFIRPGDFLFSRANTIELVGSCVIAGEFTRVLMLSDKILRLRLLGGMDRWLLWSLRSAWGRQEIESLASGNQESMRNLAQANLRRIRVPLPPPAESRRIVEEAERLLAVAADGEARSRRDVGRCGRLRQSILKWAFEGKLVDQDPNDEPADKLLARIQAERASASPTKKKTRGRKAKAS